MVKPKRGDDKYWFESKSFNHIKYEGDLEDYITVLEARIDKSKDKVDIENVKTCRNCSIPNGSCMFCFNFSKWKKK